MRISVIDSVLEISSSLLHSVLAHIIIALAPRCNNVTWAGSHRKDDTDRGRLEFQCFVSACTPCRYSCSFPQVALALSFSKWRPFKRFTWENGAFSSSFFGAAEKKCMNCHILTFWGFLDRPRTRFTLQCSSRNSEKIMFWKRRVCRLSETKYKFELHFLCLLLVWS